MKTLSTLLIGFIVGLMFCQCVFADNPASVIGVSDAKFAKFGVIVFAVNVALSAIRSIVAKFDGIDPGGQIPDSTASLTWLNRLCLWCGKVLDFVQGNVQH